MTEAPVEVWLRPGPTWDSYSTTAFPDQPDAVRYVRADLYELYEALQAWQEPPCLEPLPGDA